MGRLVVGLLLGAVLVAAPLAARDASRERGYRAVQTLLNTGQTVLGQPLAYPGGRARLTSVIVTLQPGEDTGRHLHPVPTLGHILEGELTIDYGKAGRRVFGPGGTFVEAVDTWHTGRNDGAVPVRVLVVFVGSDDLPTVIRP
jgi:quercetin dioxygenase-like cupin family protein